MTSHRDRAEAFRALHRRDEIFVIPNPWDAGSARILAALGFGALATSSGGSAAALGRLDGSLSRDEALGHAHDIAAAVSVPVSADLEDGFARAPKGIAETARRAVATGIAGFSIQDTTGDPAAPIFEVALATERVRAAVEAAHAGEARLVVTARAENYLHGRNDLADTISRLQSYVAVGAEVAFAPGLSELDDIRAVVSSVPAPVNVLVRTGAPSVPELEEAGVRRVSVGSAFAWVAFGAMIDAATELRDQGTYGYLDAMARGAERARGAFGS